MAESNITSAGTGNWNTGGTWTGGSVPATDQHAIIQNGHNVTIDANDEVKSLSIQGGGTLTGNASYAITINGEGNATYGTNHYAIDLDGAIGTNVKLILTYNGNTDLDLAGSSGTVNSLTINHADCVANLETTGSLAGNLTITAGEFKTNNNALTVGGEINITGTLTGGTSAIQATTMEINNGGTYSATSNTTTITAASGGSTSARAYWSHTGGTLKHNFGTFAFTDSSPQVEPGGPVDPSDQVATSAHTFWNVTCTGGFLPKTQRMVIGNNLTTAGNIGYNGGNYWMEVHGTWKHTAGTTNNADTCQSTRGYVRNFVLDGTGELDLKTTSMTFGSLRNNSSGPVTGVANQ